MQWVNKHPSQITEGVLVVEASADGVYQLRKRNRFIGKKYPDIIADYKQSCLDGKLLPGNIKTYKVSDKLTIVFMCVRWTYHGENKPSSLVVSMQTKRCIDLLESFTNKKDTIYSTIMGNTEEWKLIQKKLNPNWTILTGSADVST